MKTSVAALAILTLMGCRSTQSEQAYADGFKAGMENFQSRSIAISQRPLPKMKGKTKAERRTALAQRLREDGAEFRKCEERFRKLSPPPTYTQVNRLAIALFKNMADDQDRWAALVVANSPEAKGFADASDTRMIADLRRVIDEVRRVGGPAAERLKASMDALERSTGTP